MTYTSCSGPCNYGKTSNRKDADVKMYEIGTGDNGYDARINRVAESYTRVPVGGNYRAPKDSI